MTDVGIRYAPDLPFVTIDMNFGAAEHIGCGLLEDGSIACWGASDVVAETPVGSFVSVSAGDWSAAALDAEGRIWSWHGGENGVLYEYADQDYVSVVARYLSSCGARAGGSVTCSDDHVRDAAFTTLATDMWEGLCGLDASGHATCFSIDGPDQDAYLGSRLDVPDETFVDLCMGKEHVCGRTAEGDIVCWGEGGSDRLEVPPDVYVQMDCGQEQTCAVNTAGEITCWGECAHGEC